MATIIGRGAAMAAVCASFIASTLELGVGAQTLIPVPVGAGLDEGLTPLLYALKAGIFKKDGLDVTLTSGQNGAAVAAAVAGGTFNFAKSGLMSLISAHVRGIGFKLVSPAVVYLTENPTDQLVVLKSSRITSLADVNGKVACFNTLNSLDQIASQAAIDQHGGNSATVRYIEIPRAAMFGALQAGRADIALIGIPTLQSVLDSGSVRSFGDPYEAIAKRFLIAGWFCFDTFAKANPDVVRRFAAAMRESAIYCNGHTIGIDLDPSQIQPAIDAAYKYKVISTSFDARELLIS
jgi:NitT/TauT family transport system substrate-binding protein